MSRLTTFHLFPTLPIEVRLKIWSFGLSDPRKVTVSCEREVRIPGARRTVKSWVADRASPPLLFVNRESRYEALAVYAPCFTDPSSPFLIYLSFSQDTVKLMDYALPYIPHHDLLNIQNMAVESHNFAYFWFYNMDIVKSMKSLRSLVIHAERGGIAVIDVWNRYLDLFISDIEEKKEADPEWECPMITIFYGGSGWTKYIHVNQRWDENLRVEIS